MSGRVLVLAAVLSGPLYGQEWPQFRGPDGQGVSTVASVPVKWAEGSDAIRWRLPIEGLGWSSPVILDKQLWITTAMEGGKSLRAICVDPAAGKIVQNVELFHLDTPGPAHKKNSYASPTPILEKDRIYVHFGSNGTACLSTDGKVLWKQVLKYSPVHGCGSSPALVGDLLVISCDGLADPFLIALDKKTGAQRWKAGREANTDPKKFSFCTPLAIEVGKAVQVVSPFAGGVTSYDPSTGRPIWFVRYPMGYSVVPRPVYGHGMVYLSTGFDRPAILAIKVDGKGDVTDSHVAWRLEKGAPLEPSPLLVGSELYLVSDQGVATCVDAMTGKIHWQERLGGSFTSSPLFAAGNVYFQSEDGVTTVVKADKAYTPVAKNEIKGRTYASLTPIEGALFLRTDKELLRIEATAK